MRSSPRNAVHSALFLGVAALLLAGVAVAQGEKAGLSNLELGLGGPLADMSPGDLDGSATFDRRFLVTYDGTCAAPSSDSSNNGVAYQVFPFYSPGGQNADIEVVLGTLADSVLFIYCDPFDPSTPASNIVAWDDDDGVGFGSAITPADGVVLDPGVQYFAVVSGFNNAQLGTFDINLGGDLVLGSPAAILEVPTLSTWGIAGLVGLLASLGLFLLWRRSP